MTDLFIETIGTEMDGIFARGEEGTVHSVFRSAVNLRLDSGRLVTVLSAGRCPQPYSLLLSENVSFEMDMSTGERASLGSGGLKIGGLEAQMSPRTRRVCLSLGNGEGLRVPARYKEHLRALAAAIGEEGAEDGMAPIICALAPESAPFSMEQNVYTLFLAERIKKLGLLLPYDDLAEMKAAGENLAGCGVGLTPSSDDFLCGVMAVLYGAAVAGMLPPQRVREVCTSIAEGAAKKTSEISAAFLRNSGEGLFSLDVLDLLRSFFSDGGEDELVRAARRVADFGSTSGCDTMTGIWFGGSLTSLKLDT